MILIDVYNTAFLTCMYLPSHAPQAPEQDEDDGANDDPSPDQPVTAGAGEVGVDAEDPNTAAEAEEGEDPVEGGEASAGEEGVSPTPVNKAHTIARTVVNSIMPWVTVFLLKEDTDHKGNKSKTVRPMIALALTKLVARLEVMVYHTHHDIVADTPSDRLSDPPS